MLGERRWSWNQQRGPLSFRKWFRKGEIWYVRSNSVDSSLTMYVIQDPRRLTLRTLLVFCLHLDSEVKVIAFIHPTLPTSYPGTALASAADLCCLEICSRTRSSRSTWSIILKVLSAFFFLRVDNNVRVGSLCTTAKLFAGREKLLELLFVLETRFIM